MAALHGIRKAAVLLMSLPQDEAAQLLSKLAPKQVEAVTIEIARADDVWRVPNAALRVIDRAIQAHGAAGVSEDFPLASAWAHTRTIRFADGPDEVHRDAIAKLELRKYQSRD